MKSPFLGLRTVAYFVSDIDKAKAWYADVFKTQPYFDQPFYVGFDVAGYELGLHPQGEIAEKPESSVVYWGVEDIETEYARLLKLGATEHEKPQNVGGEIVVASVRDPWGNIIGIIYNPEFKLP
jgi:lactoylglutathione lyase